MGYEKNRKHQTPARRVVCFTPLHRPRNNTSTCVTVSPPLHLSHHTALLSYSRTRVANMPARAAQAAATAAKNASSRAASKLYDSYIIWFHKAAKSVYYRNIIKSEASLTLENIAPAITLSLIYTLLTSDFVDVKKLLVDELNNIVRGARGGRGVAPRKKTTAPPPPPAASAEAKKKTKKQMKTCPRFTYKPHTDERLGRLV